MQVNQSIEFAAAHQGQYLEELIEFIRIPSIGTSLDHQDQTREAAQWLANSLKVAGLDNVSVIATDGQPLVYGDWLHAGADRPTILIYGHYDVQPAEPLEEWRTPPFEPTVIDDFIYGRGTSDDKCQLYIYVKSIEAFLKTSGKLPLNVKCLFEGEEEYGGQSIERFVRENPEFLIADIAAISDSHMISPVQPAILSSIRGICYTMLDVYGPALDVHSGSYGGAIDNPLNVMGHIISGLKDKNGRILIPGFYDDVRVLTANEREALKVNPIRESDLMKLTGAPQIWGEPDYQLTERLGTRPTLDVNGIIGGYTGDGEKTIIPAHVNAKISMRLVADQDPQKVFNSFKEYVEDLTPATVQVKVTLSHLAPPSLIDINAPPMKAAAAAYLAVFDHEPIFIREGGSIPVVGNFKEHLGIETVMMGFGLPEDNIHSPNERFYIPNFQRGIETAIHFMDIYAR